MMPEENDSLPPYLMLQPQGSNTSRLSNRRLSNNKRPSPDDSGSGSEGYTPADFVSVKLDDEKVKRVLEETNTINSEITSASSQQSSKANVDEKCLQASKPTNVKDESARDDCNSLKGNCADDTSKRERQHKGETSSKTN